LRLVACSLLLPVLLLAQGAPKPADPVKQGIAAESSGNWQEAAGFYGQALTINPKLGEANFRLGKLLVEHDSFTAGVTRLEAAKTYKYDVFLVSRWLGLGYYRAGNYSSAVENYLVAVTKKPKLADVRVELANVYYANGSDDEAMEQDSIALVLDVKNVEAQMVHGRLHARRREFDLAREAYHGVITQDPKHAEAYSALAELFKSSSPDSAVYYYRKYLELLPDDATANFNLSGLYYNQSQKEPTDLAPKPDTKDTLVLKAYTKTHDSLVAIYRAGESESAFVYVGKAIKFGFSREDIYDFYVKIAQAANKRGASITALRTVLANNPKDALKWALLGQIYADSAIAKGGVVVDTAALRQSIECYKQATVLDSTMRRRTYAWIASQYYKQKQYDSSIVYNTHVIEIDPKSASAYVNRGYAYIFGKSDKVKGFADLEQALTIDPKRGEIRVLMMSLAYRDKDYNQAYDLAKTVLESDPSNEDAKAIKKNIDLIRNPPKPQE
jgi:tetratricopeptide (TPR) repeat protein